MVPAIGCRVPPNVSCRTARPSGVSLPPMARTTSAGILTPLMRYDQLIMVRGRGESPTELVIDDPGMMGALVVFILMFMILIYF